MHIFGYGSLIWRPGFAYHSRTVATVKGYERRFWQASHDHRGTPELPGRVVTLVPVVHGFCAGMLYTLDSESVSSILSALDEREQDGYSRAEVIVSLEDGRTLSALTWIADESNPSWRGGESLADVANKIANRSGPSGSNLDYLNNLHDALVGLGIRDLHIAQLVQSVRKA